MLELGFKLTTQTTVIKHAVSQSASLHLLEASRHANSLFKHAVSQQLLCIGFSFQYWVVDGLLLGLVMALCLVWQTDWCLELLTACCWCLVWQRGWCLALLMVCCWR